MRNILIVTLTIFGLALVPGCAAIQGAAGGLIPDIEAKAGAEGVRVKFDSNLGVDVFCVQEDGAVAKWLNKIPVLGELALDALGRCPAGGDGLPSPSEPVASNDEGEIVVADHKPRPRPSPTRP